MYDAIIVGGMNYDNSGRVLGPYRLRTSAENAGYSVKVIDYAWAFDEIKMIALLSSLVSPKTLVLGISAAWFSLDSKSNTWATDSFFTKIKALFPQLNIVVGGTKKNTFPILYRNSDWFFTGFSDISFVELLDSLTQKKSWPKYFKEGNTKIIDSDTFYRVSNMDDLETVFKSEDNFLKYQPMPLEVSRGCIFSCAFCTHPFLGKKSYDYIRSPENLANELKRNYDLFGVYRYTISDDTFNDSIEKLEIVRKAINIAKLPKFEFVSYIRPELIATKPQMMPILLDLGLKGAFVGIESLNASSRKAIGKGMDVNRVFDVVENLRSNGVRMHGSFIIGLPGDTEENMHYTKEFLIRNRNKLFHSWRFNELGIMQQKIGQGYSLFEKNPEQHGYRIEPIKNSQWMNWQNDVGMSFKEARILRIMLDKDSQEFTKIAAWTLATAWFHGISQEDIENKTIKEIGLYEIARSNGIKRATENFDKIVNLSVDNKS